jgi:DNA replication licensing factor MCM3
MHRYKHPNQEDGNMDDLSSEEVAMDVENDATPIYQKFDKLLHSNKGKQQICSISFIKKYLLYAKNRVSPILTDEARHFINNSYANLRSKDSMRVL